METQITQLYNPLFYYVKNRVNSTEDAEDLTQDVFYKLAKYDVAEVRNVKSWLYTIARNTITDYYRTRKTQAESLDSEDVADSLQDMQTDADYPTEADAVRQLSECVVPYINQLPEDYRTIMLLSEIEDIPQKEIAAQLGMNYVTVRSKIQRGRKKIRDMFTTCCEITQGGKGSIMEYTERKADERNVNSGACHRGSC